MVLLEAWFIKENTVPHPTRQFQIMCYISQTLLVEHLFSVSNKMENNVIHLKASSWENTMHQLSILLFNFLDKDHMIETFLCCKTNSSLDCTVLCMYSVIALTKRISYSLPVQFGCVEKKEKIHCRAHLSSTTEQLKRHMVSLDH